VAKKSWKKKAGNKTKKKQTKNRMLQLLGKPAIKALLMRLLLEWSVIS